MRKFLVPFLFLSLCWTVVVGFAAFAVQQNYRTSANDPQIQYVQDIITGLNAGQQLSLQPDGTDISSSLSPFIALYDAKGTALSANVTYNGQLPQIPTSEFSHVDKHGTTSFTWKPGSNDRFAVIVGKAAGSDQYIAVGRSLSEVRMREHDLLGYAAIAWTLLILISLLGCYWIVDGYPCMYCITKRNGKETLVMCEECGHEHDKRNVHHRHHHHEDESDKTVAAEHTDHKE
jgi:hypothetical protein